MEKTNKKSPNLMDILKVFEESEKTVLTVDELMEKTGKTRNCIIATANASSNKEYLIYHKKGENTTNGVASPSMLELKSQEEKNE